jgi:hypothetical protein
MNPAEALQAHLDLEASESIAMHFGRFNSPRGDRRTGPRARAGAPRAPRGAVCVPGDWLRRISPGRLVACPWRISSAGIATKARRHEKTERFRDVVSFVQATTVPIQRGHSTGGGRAAARLLRRTLDGRTAIPTLTDAQVARIAARGRRRPIGRGDVLVDIGTGPPVFSSSSAARSKSPTPPALSSSHIGLVHFPARRR